jgi:hypothetical protein
MRIRGEHTNKKEGVQMKTKIVNTQIDIVALWELYPIDDYPKIYRMKVEDDYRDVRDDHKKVKSVYDSLSPEDKKNVTMEWFNQEFNKI